MEKFGVQTFSSRFVAGWLLLAGLLFSSTLAEAATVSARLDRPSAAVGETFILSIVFEGAANAAQPNLPAIPNFTVVSIGQRTEMDLTRGFSRQTYDYTLSPQQAGDFTIPGFSFSLGGQVLTTQPLKVKIVPPGATVANPATGLPAVFLKLVASKTEIYLGEVLPVEVQLYVQEGRLVRLPEIAGTGFTLGKMSDPSPVTQTILSNQTYNLVTFKTVVTAVKTGPLPLGPATMPLNIPMPNSRPDIFGNRQMRQINLAADPLTIRVRPLPAENVPPGFSGAVGNYSLNVLAAPTNLAVGDPITVRVQIAGRGLLEALALPAQPAWREFKTYPPSSQIQTTDPQGISGVKNFEQVVIPQNHEITALPPFVFTYFDPALKTYRTLTGRAFPLHITPGATATPPPTLSNLTNANQRAVATDIVRIKPHPGTILAAHSPLLRQGWFLALQLAPPALWLALLIRRRRIETLANSPRLQRQRLVAQLIRDGLPQLRTLAEQKKSDDFFAALFRLLQEQIGERLDLPASSITESIIDERLRARGLTPEASAALHELFQTCNLARYAPFKTTQELAAQIPKLETILTTLQNLGATHAPAARPAPLAILLLLLCLAAPSARAAENQDFDAANKLFEQGKFSEAAFAYEKLLDAGQRSAAIYFNLGTAAYKAGHMGRAIAAFRQAERLTPRDPDLRANLQFVRQKVNGEDKSPLAPWHTWITLLTLNEWAALAAAALWIFFLLLALREFRPALKKSLRAITLAAAAAVLLLAAGLGAATLASSSNRAAVVIAKEAVVRFGPLEESQVASQLPDGVEVLVLDEKANWLEIRDATGRTGWLKRDQVKQL